MNNEVNDVKKYTQNHVHITNTNNNNLFIKGVDINTESNVIKPNSYISIDNIKTEAIFKNDYAPSLVDENPIYEKYIKPIENYTISSNELNLLTINDFSLQYEVGYRINISKTDNSSYLMSYNRYGEPNLKYISYDESAGRTRFNIYLPYNTRNGDVEFNNLKPFSKIYNRQLSLDDIKKTYISTISVNSIVRIFFFKYKDFFNDIEYRMNNIKLSFKFDIHNKLYIIKRIDKEFFKENTRLVKASEMMVLDNYDPKHLDSLLQMLPDDTEQDLKSSLQDYESRLKARRTNIKRIPNNLTPIDIVNRLITHKNDSVEIKKIVEQFTDLNYRGVIGTYAQRTDYYFSLTLDYNEENIQMGNASQYTAIKHNMVYNKDITTLRFNYQFPAKVAIMGWILPYSIVKHMEKLHPLKYIEATPNHNYSIGVQTHRKYYSSDYKNAMSFVNQKLNGSLYEYKTKSYDLSNLSVEEKSELVDIFGMMFLFSDNDTQGINLREEQKDIPRYEFQGYLYNFLKNDNILIPKDSGRGIALNKFSGLWRKHDTYDDGVFLIKRSEMVDIGRLSNQYKTYNIVDEMLKVEHRNKDIVLEQLICNELKNTVSIKYHEMLHEIDRLNKIAGQRKERISMICDNVYTGTHYNGNKINEIGCIFPISYYNPPTINDTITNDKTYNKIKKLKYITNEKNISLKFKKNLTEDITSADFASEPKVISLDMIIYTPYKDSLLKDGVIFILNNKVNIRTGEYRAELGIDENLQDSLKKIFDDNKKNNKISHLRLTNIIGMNKNIKDIDSLFTTSKNIYVTTDLSTPNSVYINNKPHICFARFSISELEVSNHSINDIQLETEDIYQKKCYPLELQSIEQLKSFFISFNKIDDTVTRLSFIDTPIQLKFEFQFS